MPTFGLKPARVDLVASVVVAQRTSCVVAAANGNGPSVAAGKQRPVGRSYRSGTALVGSDYCGMQYGHCGPTASRRGYYCYRAGNSRHLVAAGTVVAAGNTSEGCMFGPGTKCWTFEIAFALEVFVAFAPTPTALLSTTFATFSFSRLSLSRFDFFLLRVHLGRSGSSPWRGNGSQYFARY